MKEHFKSKPFKDNTDSQNKLGQLIAKRKKTEEHRPKQISEKDRKQRVKNWTTFYRRNINLYVEHRLGIKLHPFQHIMLYLMCVSQFWFAICSRGLSKSFIVAIYAISEALLRPYSEIHITAVTIPQAKKMVQEKMDREACEKLSPILKYLKDEGKIVFKYGDQVVVEFWNGSRIWVDVADDSSRGGRATMLVYEECRLLKKTIIDSVFSKMAHPRQARFLQNIDPVTGQTYGKDTRWIEECKEIYITSARFKNEWFWTQFKKTVTECYTNKTIEYNFFVGDIFLSMIFGLKTKADYLKSKKMSNELEFLMEDLNLMVGTAENAFFDRDDFKKNQVIQRAFTPPTVQQIVCNEEVSLNRTKRDNEYRILFVDYAFANTTSKEANDNTIIGCMYGIYEDGEMKKGVDYITQHDASDSIGTEHLIRTLFHQYHADYLIIDLRNGGETAYNLLTTEWVNPEYPKELWNPHGLIVCADEEINVVPKNKLDDLTNRVIDKQGIQCIIPFVGTAELNSNMWIQFKKDLTQNKLSFLIDDLDFENQFEDSEDYYSMSPEEKIEVRMPYTQTMLLINEAVNLTQEWRDGKCKLSESRMGTKDRIVACAYGNYFFSLLENKLQISEHNGDNIDYDDWKFLAGF